MGARHAQRSAQRPAPLRDGDPVLEFAAEPDARDGLERGLGAAELERLAVRSARGRAAGDRNPAERRVDPLQQSVGPDVERIGPHEDQVARPPGADETLTDAASDGQAVVPLVVEQEGGRADALRADGEDADGRPLLHLLAVDQHPRAGAADDVRAAGGLRDGAEHGGDPAGVIAGREHEAPVRGFPSQRPNGLLRGLQRGTLGIRVGGQADTRAGHGLLSLDGGSIANGPGVAAHGPPTRLRR